MTGKKPDIDADLVRKLASLLDETGLTEIEYGTENWHLRVGKGNPPAHAAPASDPAPAPAAGEAPASPPEEQAGVLTAPMVGTVHTTPEPGAPEFVKVGDTVEEGQTVLLIEAMKMFNPIKASAAGRVVRILITSGEPVEFGEPLMIIQ
jgi:acetyl-CoA carboxylase biotin carboxyl carrier protein